jgi:hypothetical protein
MWLLILLLAQLLHILCYWLPANHLLPRAFRTATPASSTSPLVAAPSAAVVAFEFLLLLLLLLLLVYCSCLFMPSVSSSQSHGCRYAHTRSRYTHRGREQVHVSTGGDDLTETTQKH